MKFLLLFLLISYGSFAATQFQEGDLEKPVTDLDALPKQEQQEIPTLDEVPMYEKGEKPPKSDPPRRDKRPETHPLFPL